VVAPRDVPGRAPLDFLEVGGELAGVGVPDGASVLNSHTQNLSYRSSLLSGHLSARPFVLYSQSVLYGQPLFWPWPLHKWSGQSQSGHLVVKN
jgi:hypothetical protein